eukprot:m.103995 g.103995  ORF g.103995 m.103995 type:complete len:64 (+) comp15613_c0_seq1:279-470(+)
MLQTHSPPWQAVVVLYQRGASLVRAYRFLLHCHNALTIQVTLCARAWLGACVRVWWWWSTNDV